MREDLCIEVGVAAWRVCIDVMCISYDGNAADAALVCAVTCLRHLKLPSTSEVDGLRFIEDGEGTTLPLQALPLPLTLGIFDDAIIADPTLMEEELLATQVTIAQTPDGRVCAIHKPGGVCMGNETMVKCLALSMEHSRRLAPIVDNATPPASA
jgi:exosome complex component RRP43